MTPPPRTATAEQLLAPLREQPQRSAILCDIDGTLAPIVHKPEMATVPARARQVLEELARRYGLVACVTGRRAAVARQMVGLDSITYFGNHGLERLEPGSGRAGVDPAILPLGERVRRSPPITSGRTWSARHHARGQGRDLGLPLPQRRGRGGGPRGAGAGRAGRAGRGPVPALGAQGARDQAHPGGRQGHRRCRRARRPRAVTRVLRRRRHDRRRRLSATAGADRRRASWRERSASAWPRRRPGRESSTKRTWWWRARSGFSLLEILEALCSTPTS